MEQKFIKTFQLIKLARGQEEYIKDVKLLGLFNEKRIIIRFLLAQGTD